MVRVLLVDDQPLIHTGLKTVLETEPGIEVADEVGDGTRGVELALELRPNVVCMDVRMPQMNGTRTTRKLTSRRCGSTAPILTTFDRDDSLLETFQAGVSGFLLKIAGAKKLIEAVQALRRGEGLLSPQVTRRVVERFTASRQKSHYPGRAVARVLTEREHDTLLHLAHGLSSAEAAVETFASPETARTHVSNILTKLGLCDRINAVIWAYKNGFMPHPS